MRQTLEAIVDGNGEWTGDYKQLRKKWDEEYDKYQSDYKEAKEKSSALESRVTELTDIEKRVSELQAKVATDKKDMATIGAPEDRYNVLRKEWQELHHERADLMEGECNNLTELSGEEIRATLQRGAGVDDIISKIKRAVTGSGLRREKMETIASNVTNSDDPIAQWDEVLHELENLARFESQETDEETLPATPIWSQAGLTNSDLLKVATKLSNEAWLELALTSLEDNPLFEYRAREGEYIPFINASAGQQATSLLKALLNQVGPPLIIDQPEDDLDNPVIFEIVEQIWEAKKQRQLIFASHNANLVVNGDAELVAWCDYRASGDQSGGKIKGEGAIDIEETRNAIKQVMEGGEQAFKLRRDKYGF